MLRQQRIRGQRPLNKGSAGHLFTLFRLFADVGEDTAVDVKDMAVYGIRSMRCEEDCRAAELARVKNQ